MAYPHDPARPAAASDPPFPRGTGGALPRLLGELREGVPWDVALDAYQLRTGRVEPGVPFAHRRINWTWLTDLDRTDRALDLGSPFGDLAADLSLEFAEVHHVATPGLAGQVAAERLVRDPADIRIHLAPEEVATAPGEGVDLAVFMAASGWRGRVPLRLAEPGALTRACMGWLRPGGWLGLLAPNPSWYRVPRAGADRSPARDLRLLRSFRSELDRAGATVVREYLVAPDLEVPAAFVPRSRASVLAFQRARHVPASDRWLARAGLQALLFPAVLLLAKR